MLGVFCSQGRPSLEQGKTWVKENQLERLVREKHHCPEGNGSCASTKTHKDHYSHSHYHQSVNRSEVHTPSDSSMQDISEHPYMSLPQRIHQP